MKASDFLPLLKDSATAYSQDRAPRLAAALAYYAIFAIAPLLFLVVVVAGNFLGRESVRENLLTYVESEVGSGAAEFLQSLLNNQQLLQGGTWPTIIGVVTLFLATTGLMVQLQDALNKLWGADPPPQKGIGEMIKTRFLGFGLVLLFGLLIVAFLVGNTLLTAYAEQLGQTIGVGAFLARLVTLVLGTGLFTVMFAMVFKYLPDVRLHWRETWTGAFVTALLFTIGQILIALYFGRVSPGSVYGAAGSLVVLLLWIYLSAQIMFFGAEMTWVYSQRFGSHAGGAGNPEKKARLRRQGRDIDPTPSEQEIEAQRRTPGARRAPMMPTRVPRTRKGKRGYRKSRVLTAAARPSMAPAIRTGLSKAIYGVLALPSLAVFALYGLVKGPVNSVVKKVQEHQS